MSSDAFKMSLVTLFIVCSITLPRYVHGQLTEQGCKAVNRESPTPFSVSPADYNPPALNVSYCVKLCGGNNMPYAAVELSQYCMCASSPDSTAVVSASCQDSCIGSPTEKCGDATHANTYLSAIPIEGLDLSIPSDIFAVSSNVPIKTTWVRGSDLKFKYAFEPNEFPVEEINDFKYQFQVPGSYEVSVEASNPLVQPKTVAAGAFIYVDVSTAQLRCPIVVAMAVERTRENEFNCTAVVYEGSYLSATMDFKSGPAIVFQLPDPDVMTLGPLIPQSKAPAPGAAGTIYVIRSEHLPQDGTLTGWEFYATTEGAVKLLIFQPSCSSGTYCPDTNSCLASCGVTCNTGQKYCPLSGICIDAGGTCTSPSPTTLDDYTVLQSIDQTATVGYNFVPQPVGTSSFNLTAGVIIGVFTTTGVVGVRTALAGETAHQSKTGSAPAQGAALTFKSGWTANDVVLLRAIVTKSVDIVLYNQYDALGDFPTQLTILSTKTAKQKVLDANIAVQVGVDYCLITFDSVQDKPFKALTNEPFSLAVLETTGNGVLYDYNLGDGTPVVTLDSRKITRTYTARNIYNLTVRCYNLISSKSNASQVIVEDKITIDSLVAAPSNEVNTNAVFNLTMSSGTRYHCNWTWADEQVYITETYDQLLPLQERTHNYLKVPKSSTFYEVTVTCRNLVASDQKTARAYVYERILGLAMVRTGGEIGQKYRMEWLITNGSAVKYEFTPAAPLGAGSEVIQNCPGKSCQSQEFTAAGPASYTFSLKASNAISVQAIDVVFTIDSPISNASITYQAEATVTVPGTAADISIAKGKWIEWAVTMDAGTSVTTIWNYQDGTNDTVADLPLAVWSGLKTKRHTFNTPGSFEVSIDARNGCSNFTKLYRVIVYESPTAVTATLNFQPTGANIPAGTLSVTIVRSDGGGSLGYANAQFTWGDGTSDTIAAFEFGTTYSHVYGAGQFTPSVVISNVFGSKEITGVAMNIVQGLEDVFIQINPENVAINSPVVINVNVSLGSSVKMTYDFGLGSGPQTTPLPSPNPIQTTYTSLGSFKIEVDVSNPINSWPKLTHMIEVQQPVVASEFTFTTTSPAFASPPGTVTFQLAFTGSNKPTAPTFSLDYGDKTAPVNLTFDANTKTYSYTYATTGCYNATLLIFNLCSNATYTVEVKVAQALGDLTFVPKYKLVLPLDGPDLPGKGPLQNTFTTSRDLRLHPNITGTVMEYEVNVESDVYMQTCNADTDPLNPVIIVPLNKTGTFAITLKARNHLGEKTATVSVVMIQGIGDFTVTVTKGADITSTARQFSVQLASYNDGTCLLLMFGDNVQNVFGGDKCKTAPYTQTYPQAVYVGPLSQLVTLTHTYATSGVYAAQLILEDDFDKITQSQTVTVSSADCENPEVSISNATYPFYSSTKCQRGTQCVIRGKIGELTCASTFANKKTWTMVQIDPNDGSEMKQISLTSIASSVQSTLIIPPRFLDYGFYCVTFTVSMEVLGVPGGFTNSTNSCIQIVRTPLDISQVDGGMSVVIRGVRKLFILDPEKYSKDPDMPPEENQGFTKFVWECYETTNETLDSTRFVSVESPLDPAVIRQNGGCYGTGPGRLQFSGGMVAINPGLLLPDAVYNSTVQVCKEERCATNTLIIKTIDGDPPEVTIRCKQSALCVPLPGGKMISGSYNILLEALCSDPTCPSVATYLWTVFYNKTNFGWRPVPNVDRYLLGFMSTSVELRLPTILLDFPTNNILVVFNTSAPDRPQGSASLILYVNYAPVPGNCTISPTSGTAGTTSFTLQCLGWTDDSGPINLYELVAQRKGEYGRGSTVASMRSDSLVTTLMAGSDMDDYKMTLWVVVNDIYGSSTNYSLGVITVSPNVTDFAATLNDYLNNPQSDFARYEALAEPQETSKWLAALSSSLNRFTHDQNSQLNGSLAQEMTAVGYGRDEPPYTPPGVYTLSEKNAERDLRTNRAILRRRCLITMNNMPAADIDSVNTFLTSVTEITKETADTARTVQNETLFFAKSMAKRLEELGAELPSEKLDQALEKLVEITGNYAESMSLSNDAPNNLDLDESKATMEYDTDLTSEKGWLPKRVDLAEDILADDHNKDVQNDVVTQNQGGMDEVLDTITRVVMNHTVAGAEPRDIRTPKMQFRNQFDSADAVLKQPVQIGRSTVNMPSNVCDLVGCDDDDDSRKIIAMRSTAQPNSPWKPRVKPDVATVPSKSDVISVDMMNPDGTPLRITNSTKEIEIFINRQASLVEESRIFYTGMVLGGTYRLQGVTLNISNPDDPFLINLEPPTGFTGQVQLFIRYCDYPNISENAWNLTYRMPQWWPNDTAAPPNYVPRNDPFTVILEPEIVQTILATNCSTKGQFTIGIRFLDPTEYNLYNETYRPPNTTWQANATMPNFYMSTVTTNCGYIDKTSLEWKKDGCRVGPKTTLKVTQCFTRHLTSFGSGWVVMPNTIDWGKIMANASFDKNPTLYITFICIWVIFIILAIVCRRFDLKDVEKCGLIPILDNNPRDHYLYEMTVATGIRRGGGTHSKVHFILSGEFDESDVRVLNEQPDYKRYLNRGSIDNFLLAVPRPLGPLNYMRIWHDNSGQGKFASWYLKYIVLTDVQTKERFSFIAGKWFAVEEDDGQIDRLLPVAGREQMREFSHLFTTSSRKNLGDGHLWFSVAGRPPRSRFTRLQRLSCCFQILMLSMMGSAMFYGKEKTTGNQGGINIGPFNMTPNQLFIAVMTNLIIFPPTFLTVYFFRKTRPRRKRPNRIREALAKNEKLHGTASLSDVRAELSDTAPLSDNEHYNKDSSPPSTAGDQRPELGDALLTDINEAKKKKKKRVDFPWWVLIVSWVFLWASTLAGAFVTILYGIMFEDMIVRRWLTSFCMSIVMSAFVTQPIKVFLLALFISLILKKPSEDDDDEDEDEEPYTPLAHNEQWLYNPQDLDSLAAARPRTIAYQPPDMKMLEQARQSRVKEVKMYSIMREIGSFVVFVWILLMLSYSFRDPAAYNLQQQMEKVLLVKQIPWPGPALDFMQIEKYDDFWDWLQQVFVPALRADLWYSADHLSGVQFRQPYGQRGFMSDRTSRLMGWAIMRQLRTKRNTCIRQKEMQLITNECNDEYDMMSQEEGTFGDSWRPLNGTMDEAVIEYTYQTGKQLQGFPYIGQLAIYDGGGYAALFKGKEKDMQEMLQRLKDGTWIDDLTRAVFIEFSIFNPNSKLFSVNTLLVEFPHTTGAVPSYRFDPVDLLNEYHQGAALIQLLSQIGFILFLIYFFIHEVREIVRMRASYFSHLWNWTELSIVVLSVAGIVIYFYRLYLTKDLVRRFMESKGLVYIKFQTVAQWHELLMYIVGLVVFLSTLKFIKLLRFNKRMGLLAATLRECRQDLGNFAIMFGIIFFAYMQLFYLVFLKFLEGYKTVVAAAETNMNIMLGKFDFQDMMLASPVLAPLFFFLYVLTMVMIVMNMFISVLCEAFTTVRADIAKQGNDFEMVDYIMSRFKSWSGLKGQNDDLNNTKSPLDGASQPFEVQIDNFPHKVDKLLNSISKVYFDSDNLDLLFDPAKINNGNRDLYRNLLKNNALSDKTKSDSILVPDTICEEIAPAKNNA